MRNKAALIPVLEMPKPPKLLDQEWVGTVLAITYKHFSFFSKFTYQLRTCYWPTVEVKFSRLEIRKQSIKTYLNENTHTTKSVHQLQSWRQDVFSLAKTKYRKRQQGCPK